MLLTMRVAGVLSFRMWVHDSDCGLSHLCTCLVFYRRRSSDEKSVWQIVRALTVSQRTHLGELIQNSLERVCVHLVGQRGDERYGFVGRVGCEGSCSLSDQTILPSVKM